MQERWGGEVGKGSEAISIIWLITLVGCIVNIIVSFCQSNYHAACGWFLAANAVSVIVINGIGQGGE